MSHEHDHSEGAASHEAPMQTDMTLIIVRHGDYKAEGDLDGGLSGRGQSQIRDLGEKLRPHIGKKSVLILSSPAPRAFQSAAILAEEWKGAAVEPHDVLFSENGHPENFAAAHDLISSKKGDAPVIVLVTHFEYTEGFPGFLGQRYNDEHPDEEGFRVSRWLSLQRGEAVVMNYGDRSVTPVFKDY